MAGSVKSEAESVDGPDEAGGAGGKAMQDLIELRRRIYVLVLPLGIAAMGTGLGLKLASDTLSTGDGILLVGMCAVGAGMLVLLILRVPNAVRVADTVMLASGSAALAAKLFEILFVMHGGTHHPIEPLADLLYWFPLMYMMAFLLCTTRRGLLASGLLLGVVSGGVLLHLFGSAHPSPTETGVLIRFVLGNVLYIVLAASVSLLSERNIRMTATASNMERLARVDFLTGLPNRRATELVIEACRPPHIGQPNPCWSILVDVDHFKRVNDTHGHDVGDTVLKAVARVLRQNLRTGDHVGRWGGEEFLVILPHLDEATARMLAERLRQGLANERIAPVGQVTASFGLAPFVTGVTPEAWIKASDVALYQAKTLGRNRVERAMPEGLCGSVDSDPAGPSTVRIRSVDALG